MPDREKVLSGLEYCITHYNCRNLRTSDCPYLDLCEPIKNATGDTLMRDALALLKEQEAVVRCKDCRFRYAGENEVDAWDRCKLHCINTAEDNYCSWAVHK